MSAAPRVLSCLLRHWWRHKLQCGICLLGIALGVAVVTAMDTANSSALASFRESIGSISGRATHQIACRQGVSDGLIPETLFTEISRQKTGALAAAPVLDTWAHVLPRSDAMLPNSPGEASAANATEVVRVLGIDPLVDGEFRAGSIDGANISGSAFQDWLLRDDACVLHARLAERFQLKSGGAVNVLQAGRRHALKLWGTFDSGAARADDDILLMDIAAAQERFGTLGRINTIDLILPGGAEGEAAAARIRALLPESAVLQRPAERAGRTEALLSAFQLNLRALSMLALVVGVFLIHNTLTVAVLQRLPMLGTLRCLGVSANDVRRAIMFEALVLGTLGSVLGLLAGSLLARIFLLRIGATISDLYVHLGAVSVFFDPAALLKGFLLGVLASLAGAFFPAREAATVAPTQVLRRSRSETRARSQWLRMLLGGAFCAVLAGVLSVIPANSPAPGLAAAFVLAVGTALAAPAATLGFSRLMRRPLQRVAGTLGALAARGLSAGLSRTGLAVGALGIALSMTIGVALMVSSFRVTLDRWMDQTLQADVYIRPAGPALLRNRIFLPPDVMESLRTRPEVIAVDTYRGRDVALSNGAQVLVSATDTAVSFSRARERYPLMEGDPKTCFDALRSGAVFISESMLRKQNLHAGGEIELPVERGTRRLPIAAVYYEYATERGVVYMDTSTYAQLYGDARPNSASLYLKSGVDVDALRQNLRETIAARSGLYVFSNRSLREEAFRVFDRTFAITGQLENLSLTVGLCGILSALLALLRERSTEFALLRALGLSSAALFRLVLLEGLLLGLLAFLCACVAGPLLSEILIRVINVKAFGWTLVFSWDAGVFVRTGVLALSMAAAAALLPAWRARKLNIAGHLREE